MLITEKNTITRKGKTLLYPIKAIDISETGEELKVYVRGKSNLNTLLLRLEFIFRISGRPDTPKPDFTYIKSVNPKPFALSIKGDIKHAINLLCDDFAVISMQTREKALNFIENLQSNYGYDFDDANETTSLLSH